MTIGSISGSSWATTFASLVSTPTNSHSSYAAVATSGSSSLGMLQPGDSEEASLTSDDRAMIAKMTKVNIHDDGAITYPYDIDGATFAATLEAAKILAHGRATGTITGATDAGAFMALVNSYRKAITDNRAASGITGGSVDLTSRQARATTTSPGRAAATLPPTPYDLGTDALTRSTDNRLRLPKAAHGRCVAVLQHGDVPEIDQELIAAR